MEGTVLTEFDKLNNIHGDHSFKTCANISHGVRNVSFLEKFADPMLILAI